MYCMSNGTSKISTVDLAYRKFKQYVYYDQLDLVLRQRVAQFETDKNLFHDNLEILKTFVDELKEHGDDFENFDGIQIEILNKWLGNIWYHTLPKKIKKWKPDQQKSDSKIKVYSNNNSSNKYTVEGINYFIDAPIELQILCTIWVMQAGKLIENNLTDSCYSYRLNEKVLRENDRSSHLYNIYYEEYTQWRDRGIKKAIDLHKNENLDVAIISMDLKQCFYNVVIDFQELKKFLKNEMNSGNVPSADKKLILALTDIIQKIHETYHSRIENFLDFTHIKNKNNNIIPLPIGLISSGILCNWRLNDFDKKVYDKLNPAYYGRYVDDLLFVIANPVVNGDLDNKESISTFLEQYFVKSDLLNSTESGDDGNRYEVKGYQNFTIHNDKIVIHYYERNHSCALLQKFKNRININSSSFYLLPSKKSELDIFNEAYELIYEGSDNVFRSIDKVIENRTGFSKTLTKLIVTLNEVDVEPKYLKDSIDQIFRFNNGLNYLNYARFWEKIFSFTLIKNRFKESSKFYRYAHETIVSISDLIPEREHDNSEPQPDNPPLKTEIINTLKKDLQEHLLLSLSVPFALLSKEQQNNYSEESGLGKDDFEILEKYSEQFRHSNMLRHHYIVFPLLNYIEGFNGSFIDFPVLSGSTQTFAFSPEKIRLSPRHIHFDEYQLSKLLCAISNYDPIEKEFFDINAIYQNYKSEILEYRGHPIGNMEKRLIIGPGRIRPENDGISVTKITINSESVESRKKRLRIGIANIQLSEKNLQDGYQKPRKWDLSFNRIMKLNSLLNNACKEKCDFLIFPELSIPYRWLPYMVQYSRRHQIGLIFGLEYWISNDYAFNLIVTTMPYKDEDKYYSCCVSVRNKNHYAPKEILNLEESGLKIPSLKSTYSYHLIKWQGVQFAVYNCFELADIRHRSLFRSELDLLVACVWNKDVKYFATIMESTIRELHCYGVQVNNTEYGDSRIIQPTKSEKMNIIQVKGGDNPTILVAELEIDELRKFQNLHNPAQNDEFKPLPPGFEKKHIAERFKWESADKPPRK